MDAQVASKVQHGRTVDESGRGAAKQLAAVDARVWGLLNCGFIAKRRSNRDAQEGIYID